MKNISRILWGIVFILVGGILALNLFGITDIDIFFDGWWTLFIIVPCFVGIFSEREKTGNIIGLLIGVFLLLSCQGIISFDLLWKLAVPVIIIIIGLKMVLGALFGDKAAKMLAQARQNSDNIQTECATFAGRDMNFDGELFSGAEFSAVFGGVKCDLRNAIIEKDCAITATAVFGGIDLYVPDHVKVKISSNSIFGGVSEKKRCPVNPDAVTLYINATCIFGGVEVK